jgi:hypothetical protein
MLVMYLCVRVINVSHVFVCSGYQCWSCICVFGLSMLVMYLCVRAINVGHVFVCSGYQCWSCICAFGLSMLPFFYDFHIDFGLVSTVWYFFTFHFTITCKTPEITAIEMKERSEL